jgi:predicted DNA-binding transcriptional regulator AlpA
MYNPFDLLLERFNGLEAKLSSLHTGNSPLQPEIINRDELCKRLAITEPTAIRWEKKGTIPSFRIGSNVRYNWPKVIETLESQKQKG